MEGVDIVVKIGTDIIGGQKGASLSRSVDTVDKTTKDSSGWKVNRPGLKGWNVDCDGLVPDTNAGYTALQDAFENGTELDIVVSMPNSEQHAGKAIITEASIEAPFDDDATYSVSFLGTGALTHTPAV